MDGRAGAAEEAVVVVALARGLLTAAHVENARRGHAENVRVKGASSLLALLARHLRPEHRDELRKVYADALQASGTLADAADAEATAVLDMPALARPPLSETFARPSTEKMMVPSRDTLRGIVGAAKAPPDPSFAATEPASTFGSSPGASAKDATDMDPQPAGAVRADEHVTFMDPRTKALASVGAPIAATLAVNPPAGAGAPPTEIAGFTIVRELGRGGMGVVYEATHATHGQVALKVLLAGELATGQDVERFKLEARSCASLSHPNVVRVYEHGQDSAGRWFMAMEFIAGESLDGVIRREGALQPLVAARIARDVANALAAAHAKSILHRDVKPHNVLMDGDTPRLTDFGLAKLVGDAKSRSLTNTGGVLGTPGYMAPEQAGGEGKKIDQRADVYGVGSLLYHLLTGRAPFEGDSLANVLVAVLQKTPVPLTERRPGLPRDLETICFKCLEKDPVDRYQSAKELALDLERFIGAQEIKARPTGMLTLALRAARAHGAAAAVAIAGGLALALGVVLAVRAQLPPAPPTATAGVPATPPKPPTEPSKPPVEPVRVRPPVVDPPVVDPPVVDPPVVDPPVLPPTQPDPEPPVEPDPTAPARPTRTPPQPDLTTTTEPTPTTTPPAPTPTTTPPAPTPTPADPGPPERDPTPETPTARVADVRPPALDERTVEWLAWRCLMIRQASSMGAQGAGQLHLARSLRSAVAEARERNVPLVIAMLGWGDELPSFFRERAALDLLNEGFVVLLAQKAEHTVGEGNKDNFHLQLPVDGESRCARQPMTTCELHEKARKQLKDDDRDPSLFPGGQTEIDNGDNRFMVWVPGSPAADELWSERERTGRPQFTGPAMTKALLDARAAMGAPRFPLSALADIMRADENAAEGRFKKAITALHAAEQSEHELVRGFARHRLEVGLPERCAVAIAEISSRVRSGNLTRTQAKSALQKLKREVSDLAGCPQRVEDAIGSLPQR